MPFLILFILIPLAEVYVFLNVSEEIGILKTLLLCVVTAIIGGTLVKIQGLETLVKARQRLMSGDIPLDSLFDGICLIIAGGLLLIPGFVTDAMGFSLLIPPFRKFLRRYLSRYSAFKMGISSPPANNPKGDIIEGDYEEVTKEQERLDKTDKSR